MLKRVFDIGLAALLAGTLAAPGAAFAQDEFGEDEFGEEEEFGEEDEFGEEEEFDDMDEGLGDEGAEAEGEVEGEAAAEVGQGEGMGLVLPVGGIGVYAPLEINLSDSSEFEPTSLAPDVWYGVTPELSAGLVHSTFGSTGFYGIGGAGLLPFQGAGICFTGSDAGCPEVYNNVGVNARYLLMGEGSTTLAVDGGLYAVTLDPFALALKGGVVGTWSSGGPLSVLFNPNLFIGITERDAFNKTSINLPVSVNYMVNEQLHAMVQTGIKGPIEEIGGAGFGDLFTVPLSIGAAYMIQPKLGVVGAFSLPAIVSGDGFPVDGFDYRALTVAAVWYK